MPFRCAAGPGPTEGWRVLFNHHFLHWPSDQAAGKMSPVVVLGERRALRVSGRLARAACAALGLAVLTGA